jgi:hypothetical protein
MTGDNSPKVKAKKGSKSPGIPSAPLSSSLPRRKQILARLFAGRNRLATRPAISARITVPLHRRMVTGVHDRPDQKEPVGLTGLIYNYANIAKIPLDHPHEDWNSTAGFYSDADADVGSPEETVSILRARIILL